MSDKGNGLAVDDFSPLQNALWRTTAAVETVVILLFASRVTDLSDPVIAVIFAGICLVVAWLARKWVKVSATDDKIRSWMRRG